MSEVLQLVEAIRRLTERTATEHKTKKDLKLNSGDVIPAGTPVMIRWYASDKPRWTEICELAIAWTSPTTGRDYTAQPMKTSIMRLPDQVTGITKAPPMSRLEKLFDTEGQCPTPLGTMTDIDGTDPSGAPSWALIYGVV